MPGAKEGKGTGTNSGKSGMRNLELRLSEAEWKVQEDVYS